jgi:hypothetical protein
MLHKLVLIWKFLDRVFNPEKYASHEEESDDDKMQTKVAWADTANDIELFVKFAEEQPLVLRSRINAVTCYLQ